MDYVIDYLSTMERFTMVLGFFLIVWSIGLGIYRKVIQKKNLSDRLWKVLCVIPLTACIVHWSMYSMKGQMLLSVKFYLPLYAGAILMAIWMILASFKKSFKGLSVIVSLLTMAGVIGSFIYMLVFDWTVIAGNATKMSYADSIKELSSEFQANYVLSEWKEIDYEALEAEIIPLAQEADRTGDETLYYEALCLFVSAFNDGHIGVESLTEHGEEIASSVYEEKVGNDYGFSLFTVDSGETIAILVKKDSEAEKAGISVGTVITKWNGVDIDEAMDSVDYELFDFEPIATNFEIVKPIYFAGHGGEVVEVSFIAEDGTEKTVKLNSIGSYVPRREIALLRFFHIPDIDLDVDADFSSLSEEEQRNLVLEYLEKLENFQSKMISEDCGYLLINEEQIDRGKDSWATVVGEYPEVRELVDNKLEELSSQGMKRLVIDLRNNAGGIPIIFTEIVSLFTNENIEIAHSYYNFGSNKECRVVEVKPNGKWADLPVVVITNANCASCGDGMTYAFTQCENVTVIGMTESAGIFQAIGGKCYMTNGDYAVAYPIFPHMDSNGEFAIDAGADRIGRVPLDVKIPVTKEAAIKMFSDMHYDYELEYALGLFEQAE